MKRASNRVPVLVANPGTGDLDTVVITYRGPIPPAVVSKFHRYFRRQVGKGVYYPAEPLDVYNAAWVELEKRAARLPPYVTSPVGYLFSASRLILLKLRRRLVDPLRAEYRAVERVTKPAERCGEACDQEMDASCDNEERVSYDANDLAEMLVSPPDPYVVRRQAIDCLEETFAKLSDDTVRAFRAWIHFDGRIGLAAASCGESRFAYQRKWPKRVQAFRKACTWTWCAFL